MTRLLRAFALALALVATPALAQRVPAEQPAAPDRAEVLVLGVYHMANPGHDIFNMQVDDVLAPKRQAEISQVIEALKRFRPTKVAVEREAGDSRISRDFAAYLAGTHELTRNEIEQLGFRLAKELGHGAVFPVDADGDFPYQRLVNYARGSGRAPELDAIMGEFGARVKAQGEYLASHTILETLLWMNADERAGQEVGVYYRMARIGEPGDWAGADLVSEWFRRNLRIFGNVVRLADSPKERVLVIFGAGHLAWLRHDFAADPAIRLRTLADVTRPR